MSVFPSAAAAQAHAPCNAEPAGGAAVPALGIGRKGAARFSLAALTPAERRILLALRGTRPGRRLGAVAIADAIYADREDGGPDRADQSVRALICYLRRKLRGGPVRVESSLGQGGGYWLGGPAAGVAL